MHKIISTLQKSCVDRLVSLYTISCFKPRFRDKNVRSAAAKTTDSSTATEDISREHRTCSVLSLVLNFWTLRIPVFVFTVVLTWGEDKRDVGHGSQTHTGVKVQDMNKT